MKQKKKRSEIICFIAVVRFLWLERLNLKRKELLIIYLSVHMYICIVRYKKEFSIFN